MNVFLCGPPGVGKSTVARLVANKLQWKMIDTDEMIQEKVGRSCREFHLEVGEKTFREVEGGVVNSLHEVEKTVVALGGGALEIPAVGLVVYLEASFEQLWKRIQKRKVLPSYLDPLAPEESYREHIAKRLPLYMELSDFVVDTTDLSLKQVADCVVRGTDGIK